MITATTVNGKTASCTFTVTAKQQTEEERVIASIKLPASIQPGASLPIDFQLEKMKRVATVSFVFERDGALTGGTAAGEKRPYLADEQHSMEWQQGHSDAQPSAGWRALQAASRVKH